jgi:RAB protein geranylgeranyltransferase component A
VRSTKGLGKHELTLIGSFQGPFTNASTWKPRNDQDPTGHSEKLSSSRAYTLALGPQLMYSRSKLIAQLVSSKVYKQLEFQAVGNWWVYSQGGPSKTAGKLERLPNGREDVFSDSGIDLREKRSLMKFLKFVVEYENQTELWEPHAESPLHEFLRDSFGLTPLLTTRVIALTLSLDLLPKIRVGYALPRIARHLTSIGVFGPGFGAVIPKWGGASEITQVACRAGAVGGGVYMLGIGVKHLAATTDSNLTLTLANGEVIRTKAFVRSRDDSLERNAITQPLVSKMISIIASDFAPLFTATVEGAPPSAVSVVAFPPFNIDVDGESQAEPVYIMVHSSDTGECPAGQCKCLHSYLNFHLASHDDPNYEYLSTLSDFF